MRTEPLTPLLKRCIVLTGRIEAYGEQALHVSRPHQAMRPAWIDSDLQRVYAIEWLLMLLEAKAPSVAAEVAHALSEVLETIGAGYEQLREPGNRAKHKGRGSLPALTSPPRQKQKGHP